MKPTPALLVVALCAVVGAALPAYGQDRPISYEEEAALKRRRAELDGVTALTLKERLLKQRPETFHVPLGGLDRPALRLMADLMVLDVTLRLSEYGGIENLDRVQSEVQLLRRRGLQDPALLQQAIATQAGASEAERVEASRAQFTMQYILDHARTKEAPAAPAPAPKPLVTPPGGELVQKTWTPEWKSELKEAPALEPPPSVLARDTKVPDVSARERADESLFGALERWLRDAWAQQDLPRLAIAGAVALSLLGIIFLLVTRRRRRS